VADAEFTLDLGVTGADAVTSAATAFESLSSKLELATTEAAKAADAMKAGQAAYDQAEATANRAALAVERIGIKADAQRGKLQAAMDAGDSSGAERAAATLQRLTQRQAEAAAKADAAKAALATEAASLDKLTSAAKAAADKEAALTRQHKATTDAEKAAADAKKRSADALTRSTEKVSILKESLMKLGGPLGMAGSKAAELGSSVLKVTKSLGAAGPYVAAAVLAVALATGMAAATLAITKFGVESADTARTQALLSDGIAGSVAGGRELDATLADLGNKVPQTRDELASMAADLAKTGLKGAALSTALEDAAIKAAKLKWGPDFAKQMLSLPNQAAKLKANLSGLFSGLKIDALLEGLAKIVGLFDSTSASGKAIKVIFESLFQPVVDGITAMVPKAIAAFLQLEILALKAMIAIKPYGDEIKLVAYAFGVLAAAVVIAIGLVIGILVLAVAQVAAFVAAGLWLQNKLTEVFNSIGAFFKGLDLAQMGKDMLAGLAAGITNAGPAVLEALKGVVSGAIDSAKKLLGIASPSKVFAEIGAFTAEGMSQGVEASTGDVQGSLENMVAPPAAASGGGSKESAGGGNFAGAVFNFYGVEGAEDALDRFLRVIEGDVAQAGGAVPT
jgi:hypothetical protein